MPMATCFMSLLHPSRLSRIPSLPDGCLPTVVGASAWMVITPVGGGTGNLKPSDVDVQLAEVGAILAGAEAHKVSSISLRRFV